MTHSKAFELSCQIKNNNAGQIELLEDLFVNTGIRLDEIVQVNKLGQIYLSLFFSTPNKLSKVKQKIKSLKLKGVALKEKTLLKHEWLTKWKNDFKPFVLTKRFSVIPDWDKRSKRPQRREPILIGEGIAFGTGLHPTTRYMAQFIERCSGRIDHFLDIGTGTGILSIIAHKCGAKSVAAIDISQTAIKAAKNNFKLNQIDAYKAQAIDFAKWKGGQKYHFVAANLITEDLIHFKNKISRLVDRLGYLAISGISVDNFKRVKSSFAALPLRCIKQEKGEGWCGILYKRIN